LNAASVLSITPGTNVDTIERYRILFIQIVGSLTALFH
jgi:hypothetical protein